MKSCTGEAGRLDAREETTVVCTPSSSAKKEKWKCIPKTTKTTRFHARKKRTPNRKSRDGKQSPKKFKKCTTTSRRWNTEHATQGCEPQTKWRRTVLEISRNAFKLSRRKYIMKNDILVKLWKTIEKKHGRSNATGLRPRTNEKVLVHRTDSVRPKQLLSVHILWKTNWRTTR